MRHEAGDEVEELAEEDGGLDREHRVPGHYHLDTETLSSSLLSLSLSG